MFKQSAKRFIQAGSAVALAAVLTIFSSCGEKHTPESLFKDTIKNEVKELSESSFGKAYEAVKNAKYQDVAGDVNLKIELGNGLKPFLRMAQSYAGIDLSFLNDVSLDYKIGMNKDLFGGDVIFNVNDNKIISANFILDENNEALYFGLPELFSKSFVISDYEISSAIEVFKESMESSTNFFKMLPAKANADKLVNDILDAILVEVKDVKEKDKTITVNGEDGSISVECKELSFKVDSETADAMAENLKKTLSKSKEFDKFLESIATYLYDNGYSYYYDSAKEYKDDIKEEIINGIPELFDELFGYYDTTIVLYADTSKNLHGIKFIVDDDYLDFLYPNTKKDFGVQITYHDDYYDETYTVLNGYCKKSGDKSTGTMKISYEDNDYLIIGLEDFSYNEHGMLGTLILKPTYELVKELSYASYYYDTSFLQVFADSTITIEGLEAKKDYTKCRITYEDEYETEYFTAYLTSKVTGNKSFKIPSDAVDIDDMEYYEIEDMLSDIPFEAVAANLEKAGAPEEITSVLANSTIEDLENLLGVY